MALPQNSCLKSTTFDACNTTSHCWPSPFELEQVTQSPLALNRSLQLLQQIHRPQAVIDELWQGQLVTRGQIIQSASKDVNVVLSSSMFGVRAAKLVKSRTIKIKDEPPRQLWALVGTLLSLVRLNFQWACLGYVYRLACSIQVTSFKASGTQTHSETESDNSNRLACEASVSEHL
jgi:hypothetical protein